LTALPRAANAKHSFVNWYSVCVNFTVSGRHARSGAVLFFSLIAIEYLHSYVLGIQIKIDMMLVEITWLPPQS
jgi:hypothetical protein